MGDARNAGRHTEDAIEEMEAGGFDFRLVIAPLALLALIAVVAGIFMANRTRGR